MYVISLQNLQMFNAFLSIWSLFKWQFCSIFHHTIHPSRPSSRCVIMKSRGIHPSTLLPQHLQTSPNISKQHHQCTADPKVLFAKAHLTEVLEPSRDFPATSHRVRNSLKISSPLVSLKCPALSPPCYLQHFAELETAVFGTCWYSSCSCCMVF